MRKRMLAMIFAALMACTVMTGCGGGTADSAAETASNSEVIGSADEKTAIVLTDETEAEEASEPAAEVQDETKEETAEKKVTYKSILKKYTKKMKKKTPVLVEEYNEECKELSGDLEALAQLSTEKVEDLAEICNTGVEEMADLMLKNGDDYDTYEKWAGKLQDVSMELAQEITDAYMDSAM